jgi:hypothetical protein
MQTDGTRWNEMRVTVIFLLCFSILFSNYAFASKSHWDYGSGLGSKSHWDYGSGFGNKYHWDYGSGIASKSGWDYGSGQGTKSHWDYGSGRTFNNSPFIDLCLGLISDGENTPDFCSIYPNLYEML